MSILWDWKNVSVAIRKMLRVVRMIDKITIKGRQLSLAALMMLASIAIGGTAGAATLTVDDSGGADYAKIQDAIDNASAGDTILVYSGTYYEKVNVTKQLTLQGVDTGSGKPVVNAVGSGFTITLSVDGIIIDTFILTNGNSGINIISNKNDIENLVIQNNKGVQGNYGSYSAGGPSYGIFMTGDSNYIANNTIQNNNGGDVSAAGGVGNGPPSGNGFGIYLTGSSNNIFTNNIVQSNSGGTVEGSGHAGNGFGIYSISSLNNTFTNNSIQNNNGGNVPYYFGYGGNGYGIYLSNSSINIFTNNIIQNNNGGSNPRHLGYTASGNGIVLDSSNDNIIYNNYFNNSNNFGISVSTNKWNITKTSGINIIGNHSIGGNFWANPSKTGFSDTCYDNDWDEICDRPYILDESNTDYLPLSNHFTVDETPPTTTIVLSGVLRNNSYYTSDVQVNLTATDYENGSGVAKIEYSFDSTNWIQYTVPFTINNKGNTTVYYRSVDKVGNVESTKTQLIIINKSPHTITVNDIGDAMYTSIQDAIREANAGDTILVYSGTYHEHVDVNKQLKLQGVDTGGGKPVVNADGSGIAITLSADGITLDGFTVTNGNNIGINIVSNNNIIKNSIVEYNFGNYGASSYGINLISSNNIFISNTVQNNYVNYGYGWNNVGVVYGINLKNSNNNTFIDNSVMNNKAGGNGWGVGGSVYGIYLGSSTGNNFINNIVQNNKGGNSFDWIGGGNAYGVYLDLSVDNNFINNIIKNNNGGDGFPNSRGNGGWNGGVGLGIGIGSSDKNIFINNTVQSNNGGYGQYNLGGSGYGINLDNSTSNIFTNNNFDNNNGGGSYWKGGNGYGINIRSFSNNNIFINNNVKSNNGGFGNRGGSGSGYGVYLQSSSNNTLYNNHFNNSNNFFISASANVWNTTRKSGTNIIGGRYVGGNFWANPSDTGFSQTCTDSDWDGICDLSYALDENNIDYLPLSMNFTLDAVPPTTAIAISGILGNNGWYISDVQVNLTALDDEGGSGVAQTEYSSDGTNWYTIIPFTLTDEGTTTVYYKSTDNAGNVESTKNQTIKIDKTPPIITGVPITLPNANGWYNNDVLINFTASDNLSGLDNGTPDTIISTDGASQNITGTAIDKAGNSASFNVTGINIDKTPPKIIGSRTPAPNGNSWNNGDVNVHFDCSDSLSGVDSCTIESVVSTEGAGQSVSGTATDKAGNSASGVVSDINIDKTPPSITGSATTSSNTNGWYNHDVIVHFTASDTVSGIYTVTHDSIISLEGINQSVTGTATDKAGNSASATVSGINIDKTPPQITMNTPTNGGAYILNQALTADWSANDSLSGIASATGTLPNDAAIDTSIVGTKTFTVVATDNAGNTATQTAHYTIAYNFLGILPPIREDGSSIFNSGSTVPVKFRIADANGNYVSTAIANLTYQLITDEVLGTIEEAVSTSAATDENTFRYDSTDNLYIFNLATVGMNTGAYQLNVNLDDGTVHSVRISLK